MQMLGATTRCDCVQSIAKRRIDFARVAEPCCERAKIKPSASNEECLPVSRFNFRNCLTGTSRPLDRGEVYGWFNDIDEVMRNPLLFVGRNLCSCNVDPTIDLDGIAIHDLAVKGPRQEDSQLAFAGSSGAYNGDKRPLGALRFASY